jgi:hypothetical protein
MRTLLACFFLTITLPSLSQQTSMVNDSIPLIDAIAQFETINEDLHFFYRPEWVKDINIHKDNIRLEFPIEESIDALLKNTRLNFYLDGKRVILLNNTTIVVPHVQKVDDYQSDYPDYTDQVSFQSQSATRNGQSQIHTIGNIKDFKRGNSSTIKGNIASKNGPVEGVYIANIEPFVNAISDENGKFSITLPNGMNELTFQSVTTVTTSKKINLFSDGELNVNLDLDVVALEEVVISAQREENIKSIRMGLTKIDPKKVSIVPALLGERDIIRVATSTPGVQNVGEGSAGINIRGGKADQNLFLLDNNTVYTTNHFFGFFSAFNASGVGELSLYKNGIPAEYGGRLSSVFDIKTKKPNKEKFEANVGLGLVTSQIQLEGPIKGTKTSVLLNGRATYSQYMLNLFKDSSIGNNEASFYDFTLRTHTQVSDKDVFSVTAYYSYDNFKIKSDTLLSFSNFSYENKVVGASWKHIVNDNLFATIEVGYSNFSYLTSYDVLPTQAFNVDLYLNEYRSALKFDYFVNEKLNYKFGIETKMFSLSPGEISPKGAESLIEREQIDEERAIDIAPYFSATYDFSDKLAVNGGVRYSIFNSFGLGEYNIYQAGESKTSSSIIGTKQYKSGEVSHSNQGPEFRFQGRYLVGSGASIKLGYGRTRQNTHLLLNAASIAPTDVWRLSGPFIEPQIADQLSVGYFKNFFGKNLIEASVEAYYKGIKNLVDFKTGAELQFNPAIETDLLQGDGRSYGVEFSLAKSTGWLTGWLNYTYSRSFVRLEGSQPSEIINGGAFFPTGYDRPHYFNSVTNYKFTRRITMTLNLVYSSGIPLTYPVGKYSFKSSENILYSNRNEFRIPSYFRTDIGINVNASHKLKKFTHSSWTFSIYNLLGRDNIYSIFFEVEDGQVNGYKMSVFPTPIPTITYNFRF